ncbi:MULTISPECIES: ABC transporter ATP-binding protein [Pseudoalteromonas]|uniref:ABC transporter ATP-binding protein n=1 Tax=Pseudoalteromonas piscicida TaxID=43662 RepID=A0AAD0RII5_PSEO7|nr:MULTISPECIES: ABC transporter ATP-binding protein [Pseudoalteromonas]ASD66927.1 ABC transporter ATP-binding protein [Pseudoalteromonas piscicida]AXR02364.1 ABC transporter ATP-binding protein [Pseudoalteromonas piscicida]KID34701.1 ABC transporter ATP-binding protein [Pseudoalteromonas flavipulchra NCIMB 2033 = ATCC BAA-314]MBD0781383.1 ABC transporter ATP-binding protein [Pseudoalteromonas flavipulchra]MBE0372728.1 putative ABC transport system ATP-binding protein [Pseudoalteromonas flavip
MLKMNEVSKIYRTDLIETHALSNVNLTIEEGEFIAVTGPSGSGKTTFLNIAGLLERFERGDYFLDGENVANLNDKKLSQLRNEKIGFIFQGFNLISDLSLYDNVEVPLIFRGIKASERKKRIEEALELVGLASRMKHHPAQLSGGQQQRVAIARALAGKPRFLLADEPTGNLDSLMARQVMDLLQEVNQAGTTLIMVTHDNELARRAGRNIQILDGELTDITKSQLTELAV